MLFLSLHQYPNYPGTGAEADIGSREGLYYNVNLPLPPGGGDALYGAAFARLVLPIVEQFSPDFALVSCGFDAHERDPLAQMQLSSSAYGWMTTRLLERLPESCPLGLILEGGYDLQALDESSYAVARALFGEPPSPSPADAMAIGPDETAVLGRIAQVQGDYWRLT